MKTDCVVDEQVTEGSKKRKLFFSIASPIEENQQWILDVAVFGVESKDDEEVNVSAREAQDEFKGPMCDGNEWEIGNKINLAIFRRKFPGLDTIPILTSEDLEDSKTDGGKKILPQGVCILGKRKRLVRKKVD